MGRARKRWAYTAGKHGAKVRIWEPRLGAPLRWDWRQDSERYRPEVSPELRVRKTAKEPVDPVLEARAIDLCDKKAATLTLAPVEKKGITLGEAYALYFDPRRKALPKSREARNEHTRSREFWEGELGIDTEWNRITPADVKAALLRVIESGKAPTALKRYNNLVTLYWWLVEMMGFETLKKPTRGMKKRDPMFAHTPRRPRYTKPEMERLIEAAPKFGERFNLFVLVMADSGARAIQARQPWRSGFNVPLEPPPPNEFAPHGWLYLPAVKGQDAMLIAFTVRQREALDNALATYLKDWEAEWQADRTDYPLIPGEDDHGNLVRKPITDTALRKMWAKLEKAAGIQKVARRAFHGSRRSWSDDVFEGEGLETLTAAGGWSRSDTPESIYVSKVKYNLIDRARKRREK